MAGVKKHKNTKAEIEAQRSRTHKNKKEKYKKLIDEKPNDPHVKIWEKKVTLIG